jgi:hypothetical protein
MSFNKQTAGIFAACHVAKWPFAHTLYRHGGDLVSTRVVKLRVHAEGQSTSLIKL